MGGQRGLKKSLIKNILIDSLSEDHVRVIEKLSGPRYDEDVAEELDIKATIIRTILNDLHAKSLVEYSRTKNKRTGWYTYLWKRRDNKIDEYIKDYLKEKLVILNNQLGMEEQNIMFSCSCGKISFDKAIETQFVCPMCNERYAEHDNSDTIGKLTSEISEINDILDKT